MAKELTKSQAVERSIITKFRKGIWSRFLEALKTYDLISEGDKIAVCVSGGKDSFLLAKLIQELKRHSEIKFEAEYIAMNPGYNAENLEMLLKNAELLDVPVKVYNSDIFEVTDEIGGNSPCYLCARMRRGFLYARAKELGCNKIALGHHKSDVIETTLIGMLYGGQIQGMLPKLYSNNFEGMQLIRPMYCIAEEEILHWASYNSLQFIACACRKTAGLDIGVQGYSARQEVKEIIRRVKEKNPDVESSVFKSLHNVQLDTLVGYKQGGKTFFMEKLKKGESIE